MASAPVPYTVLRGHQGDVQALAFDHSERVLVSGDCNGEIRVWDLTDCRPRFTKRLHPVSAGVISLHVWQSDSGIVLISQGRDGTTYLWNLDAQLIPSETPIIKFSTKIFTFCRCSLLEPRVVTETSSSKPTTVRPSSAADVASAAEIFAASVLITSGVITSQHSHEEAIQPIDGGSISENGVEESICAVENTAIRSLHACTKINSGVSALLAIPGHTEDEALVCCCTCAAILATIRPTTFTNTDTKKSSLGMCLSLKMFIGPAEDKGAAATEQPRQQQQRVLVAVGYEDGSVVIWDPASLSSPLAHGKLHSEPVMALEIDPGGTSGVSGSAEDKLISFEINYSTKLVTPVCTMGIRKEGVGDVALRPDGKLIASVGWDGRVRMYKRATGKALAILKYHISAGTAVAFGPKTYTLASGARDGTVALWDIYSKTVP